MRQQRVQKLCSLLAALAQIGMGVGTVSDKARQGIGHATRHIGVQVQHRHHRYMGAHDGADAFKQRAIGVVALGGQRGAVG